MEEKRLKISVLCASRNNAGNLRTVIGALDMLASGRHDIDYVVACDFDDVVTQREIGRINGAFVDSTAHLPVVMVCNKQRNTLGSAWNDAVRQNDSDVYALITDRALCITPEWDLYIADAIKKDDTRVTWWTTSAGPVIPIVPNKWIEAAGQLYTDYFPFWFDDTWLMELSALVHGLPIYAVQASCFIRKKNPVTKRMRDLRLWMDFFIAKRPERKEHARKIREKLGLPKPNMAPVEEYFRESDDMWAKEWQKWEAIAGDSSEPDAGYLEAKGKAEEFLNAQRN